MIAAESIQPSIAATPDALAKRHISPQADTPAVEPARHPRLYRPELDAVRFLAFACVFLHHELPRSISLQQDGVLLSKLSPGAQTLLAGTANAFGFGLPLFFILSAYLIGTLLLREKQQSGTVDLRAFYIRRMLRIWPLYFFGLAIGGCAALLVYRRPHDLVLLTTFALMAGNWFCILWPVSNPMAPLWSISIEEQFYLFCPFTVKHLSRRGLCLFSCGLIALSDVTLFVLGQMHAQSDSTIWFNSFVQFQMFGFGLLLCLLMQDRVFSVPVWTRFFLLATGVTCWLFACLGLGAKQMGPARSGISVVAGYTAGAAGCLLIVLAFLNIEQRWLPRWMVWPGKISFGLYVYHLLAISMVRRWFQSTHGLFHFLLCFASAAVVTVVLAMLSYRFLETPFLRLKQQFEIVPGRPV